MRFAQAVVVLVWCVGASIPAISQPIPLVPAPDDRPVVAVLTPMTGEYEHIGQRVARIARMAAEDYTGIRLELIDTATGAADAYDEAVQGGAVAIIGPVGHAEVEQVVARSEGSGPPIFALSGVAGVEDAGANVFRMRTSPGEQARALAAAAAGDGFAASFAVFAPDDSYGREATWAFVEEVVARGGTVSAVAFYPADDEELVAPAETLVGQRVLRLNVPTDPWRTAASTRLTLEAPIDDVPDAVFVPDYADRVADVLPFLEFHGWITTDAGDSVRLLGTSGWAGYELESAGDLAAGAWIVQVFSADDTRERATAFADAFERRFADGATEFDAQVFDAAGFVLSGVAWLDALGVGQDELGPRLLEREAFPGVCGDSWLAPNGAIVREMGLWEIDAGGYPYPVGVIGSQEARGAP